MSVIKKNIFSYICIFVIMLHYCTFSYANEQQAYKSASDETNNIVQEYKKYLSSVPPNIRKEVIEYRKNIVKINKQKIQCYEQLSQQAQECLKRQQMYKKQMLNLLSKISNQDIEKTTQKTDQ